MYVLQRGATIGSNAMLQTYRSLNTDFYSFISDVMYYMDIYFVNRASHYAFLKVKT